MAIAPARLTDHTGGGQRRDGRNAAGLLGPELRIDHT
jgi:hypothetical protein